MEKTMEKAVKGNLEEIILNMLKKQSLHGYSIIMQIRKRYGVYLGPSTIYPLLCSLQRRGIVKSEWNMNSARPKKMYVLTNEGTRMICDYALNLRVIVQDCLVTA